MISNIRDHISYKIVPDAPLISDLDDLEGTDYDEVYMSDPLKYLIKSKYRIEWHKLAVM